MGSIRQADGTREYAYDSLGNILRERRQDKGMEAGALSFGGQPVTGEAGEALTLEAASMGASNEITYAYDPLGQLIRVDDEREGATWTYRYDQGGNMLEKKRYGYTLAANLDGLTPEQVIPYAYGDTNWKDKLTAYDGKPIACDPIGNPLFYDGWTYTWKAGRMLHRMVRDGVDTQFTYDHTGLRVKKSVNGVDTLYTLNGKRITHIRKGSNGTSGLNAVQLHFSYDAQERPAIVRCNGVDYLYLHNLQGDVTGLVDMDGALVVQYEYDAWGKPISTEGSMANTLGHDNPFRYRGYVYDEETGLYYLRSRYYDPVWGRFVSADIYGGKTGKLLDHNLFAYCVNRPVMQIDSDGFKPTPIYGPTFLTSVPKLSAGDYIALHAAGFDIPDGYWLLDAHDVDSNTRSITLATKRYDSGKRGVGNLYIQWDAPHYVETEYTYVYRREYDSTFRSRYEASRINNAASYDAIGGVDIEPLRSLLPPTTFAALQLAQATAYDIMDLVMPLFTLPSTPQRYVHKKVSESIKKTRREIPKGARIRSYTV